MLTPEQLALRRTRVTATDAGKILGLSSFGGPIDVQLDKRGLSEFIDNDRAKWGNILEGPIREDFAKREGVSIAVPGTLVHPNEPWAATTPDGIIYPEGTSIYHGSTYSEAAVDARAIGGHEIKTHTVWLQGQYGPPGSDEVPPSELIQCAWNRWICAAVYPEGIFNGWTLTAFIDGLPTDYWLPCDDELEGLMIAACSAFHTEHMVKDTPVPPDGSSSYSKQQKRIKQLSSSFIPADSATVEIVASLCDQRKEIAEAEKKEERLVQHVKNAIGDAAGIEFPALGGGKKPQRISWKKSRDGTRTSWPDVMADFRPQLEACAEEFTEAKPLLEQLAVAIKTHTKVTPGSRRFVVPRSQDWKK